MSMQDPVSDMLTRIRNAGLAEKTSAEFPASKQKMGILSVLKTSGYIEDFKQQGEGATSSISVTLKYWEGEPVIRKISRVSKPGLRIYKQAKQIEPVADGLGINILSTSKGYMTDKAAREQNLGGEVVCQVF